MFANSWKKRFRSGSSLVKRQNIVREFVKIKKNSWCILGVDIGLPTFLSAIAFTRWVWYQSYCYKWRHLIIVIPNNLILFFPYLTSPSNITKKSSFIRTMCEPSYTSSGFSFLWMFFFCEYMHFDLKKLISREIKVFVHKHVLMRTRLKIQRLWKTLALKITKKVAIKCFSQTFWGRDSITVSPTWSSCHCSQQSFN